MKKNVGSRLTLRWLFSLLLGILVVGGGFFLYSAAILPSIADLPFSVQSLVILTIIVPLGCLAMYLLFNIFLIHSSDKVPVKGIRQWTVVCIFALSYSLYLVFVAFLFETSASFIPLFYRGVFLPLIIGLLTMLILTRTRLRPRFEDFLKRLFYGSVAQNESR
jgi:hypothetical protein